MPPGAGLTQSAESRLAELRLEVSVARVPRAIRSLESSAAQPGLSAVVGDTLVYTIVVGDQGPADATNVLLTELLSATTPAGSFSTTQGSCKLTAPSAVNCTLGTLAAGSSATVTITAHAIASGIATSTATVVADQPSGSSGTLEATTSVSVTAAPQYGRSVNLLPVSGKVTFHLPGATGSVVLQAGTNVPARTEVDARSGIVEVVSAQSASALQSGKFTGGRFVITYEPRSASKGKRRVLVTKLRLSEPLACARRSSTASSRRRTVRKLWANAKGTFRTEGRFAAATVRGTEWLTRDTCRGTTIYVRRGRVDVIDLLRRKHVLVKTGHRYTAAR